MTRKSTLVVAADVVERADVRMVELRRSLFASRSKRCRTSGAMRLRAAGP